MAVDKKIQGLQSFLRKFSLEDLAKSFFTLNLWLPNIAAPFRVQFLYVVLETVHNELGSENKINSYQDFENFCKQLFPLIPSFTTIEDFTPEPDWGEIKYFFKDEFYKIFYGSDLSNPYDFYYAFEITHFPFEEIYFDTLQRSPVREMLFCLQSQDHMLKNLAQAPVSALKKIEPGKLFTPAKKFWTNAVKFIDQYTPERLFDQDLVKLYTKELAAAAPLPSMKEFISGTYRTKNCRYLFIKKAGKYYPVMPRQWLAVLHDTWGSIFQGCYPDIVKNLEDGRTPEISVGMELAGFIYQRFKKSKVYPLSAPVGEDLQPLNDLVFTAIHSQDNLFLVYVTPPVFSDNDLEKHLAEIESKLIESCEAIKIIPSKLGLLAEGGAVGFRSTREEKALEPFFLIVIPAPVSGATLTITFLESIPMEGMSLDQFAAIVDEIDDVDELSDFFAYLQQERAFNRTLPLNSHLDHFATFKNSDGVLIEGAVEPNMIMLDFQSGTDFRYNRLREFWEKFPGKNFLGHPRSWLIAPERRTPTGCFLHSKTFLRHYFSQRFGTTHIFINAPLELMEFEENTIADPLMHALFDAFETYRDLLKKLNLAKKDKLVHITFFPNTLISRKADKFKHLEHLTGSEDLWQMDSARTGPGSIGVRVVYDHQKIIDALQNATDRSLQIALLSDVLDQLGGLIHEPSLKKIKDKLAGEKKEAVRFKLFNVDKNVSFPDLADKVLPTAKEDKLANKEIAKAALGLGIKSGKYSAEDAKEKLNRLRDTIVELINRRVKEFDLENSIPLLLGRLNGLAHNHWFAKKRLKVSLSHQVEYERNVVFAQKEKEFLQAHRNYRYLIEKFVQLQPNGKNILYEGQLKELLALVDHLLQVYDSSDLINYQIYPVDIEINRDYLVMISHREHDIGQMEREYSHEQAQLALGVIGNKNDTVDSDLEIESYLNQLDQAFLTDFGFSLKHFIGVQKVLQLWAVFSHRPDATDYSAAGSVIAEICSAEIEDCDAAKTASILEFLTLNAETLLHIKDDPIPAPDLPVWEHNKRLMRYDLRPLIKIGDRYYWGPYSVERTSQIWMGITEKNKLPSDIYAPSVKKVLMAGHKDMEDNLALKIQEISARYTEYVKADVFPHKLDKSINDIGDIDVFVYLKKVNVFLNIESKIIDPTFSVKDLGRMQRAIFGATKTDGAFKEGYLQKVERRAEYLKANGKYLAGKLWEGTLPEPAIVSLFVTKTGFWWTKHPPIPTEVKFIEIRLLEDFMKDILSGKTDLTPEA